MAVPSAPADTPFLTLLPVVLVAVLVIFLSGLGALLLGDFDLDFVTLMQILSVRSHSTLDFVVWELRFPRYIVAILAGSALAMAGTIVQSITRNPLGSPSLMGVTSGAAFAIVISFVIFTFDTSSRLVFGTLGGMLAASLTFALAWKTQLNPINLTLAGMSISLFFMAAITVMLVSADADARGIYYWLTGSLANLTWQHVQLLYPYVIAGLIIGVGFARPLNLLMLDEQVAHSLGLAIQWWRLALGIVAVVLTAATVAVAGPISFVGLIAPHLSRFALGMPAANNHRFVLPLSALIGAALVSSADLLAKFQEVPVGILCILIGGPLFVVLIRRQPQ
ncbi:iron chelate uptake ABC transporter (FeCT) family, permease protein [Methylophaga frappieri]|uniref:Iron chelate uptake ABC transporter (FeCT) family, permease protein n=1 Tax=Methylophaga frappieri (strain ATCC BAA-2434 / DSM 25690 / JAM7) TaxID=754477 RepID=I1YF71_METFJ|nr:iron ABC transporter permease [Methylophaga frappieri]AFJ01564.1 iron chelate uptake ABC transporter (FeCT) family, permease protein [Methylophaga frappieri]